MGYILGFVIVLLVVPLLFLFASRRAGRGGTKPTEPQKPVIRDEPAADEPSPAGASDIRANQDKTAATRRLPPS